MPDAADAASGSAIVPPALVYTDGSNYRREVMIELSNITPDPVDIEITTYTGTGTIVTDDGAAGTGQVITIGSFSGYDDTVTGATAIFTIPAYSSAHYAYRPTPVHVSYSRIQWTQSSDASVAVIATGSVFSSRPSQPPMHGESSLVINGGKPF